MEIKLSRDPLVLKHTDSSGKLDVKSYLSEINSRILTPGQLMKHSLSLFPDRGNTDPEKVIWLERKKKRR